MTQSKSTVAEFCKDCYHWSDEPKIVKLCSLHAAAPELLAALKEAIAAPNKHRPERVWDEAKAAIAAAEGRDESQG